jgi:dolichol-phosphate mannosyltransferase
LLRAEAFRDMLSIVIPVLDEAESLVALHAQICEVCQAQGYQLDLIFVDDGSHDGSWEVIEKLARENPGVRGIRFRKNFGKAAALSAGFSAAFGDRVMTLDADLQDDPAEIPRFLAAMDSGLDVVSGWKKVRHDPWHKVYPSRVFNWLVSAITGVQLHDHNCGMKCYLRTMFNEIRLYGELHRFVPVLAAARGYRVGEIIIAHRPRKFGKSKYGINRFLKGFLDLLTVKFLTGFGHRPQHLLGKLGLLIGGFGGLGMVYLAINWFYVHICEGGDPKLHERPLLLYCVAALLLGAQLISMGFLAELLTAYQMQNDLPYSIAERTDEKRSQ